MAITDKKISTVYNGRDIASLSDRPNQDGMTATELKARFDQLGKEIIPKLNALIDELFADLYSGSTQDGHTHNLDNLVDGITYKLFTALERAKLSAIAENAEVNQNAFSNVKVGSTTIASSAKTDTFELVAGLNVSIAVDSLTKKITLSATGDLATEAVQSYIEDIGNYFTSLNVEGALQEVGANITDVKSQLAKNAANIVTIIPSGTDDTTTIQSVLDNNDIPRLIDGTYYVSSLILNNNAKIITSGYKTILKQKSGVTDGTRILVIQGSNIVVDEMIYEGNINTDTGEQNHGVYIRNNTNVIQNVLIKGIIAKNIRGDGLYIGGVTDYNPTNITIGDVSAVNCYRNGVSITAGINLKIGNIQSLQCGVLGVDLESDTQGGAINNVEIGNIITSNVGILASGGSYPYVQNVEIGFVECRKTKAGSTPDYPTLDTDNDGITFRNARNIKIKGLDIDGFDRFAVQSIINVDDRYSDNIEIGSLVIANCSLNDVTYNSYVNMAGFNLVKIGYVKSTTQTGKAAFKGTSKTANEQNIIIGSSKHSGGVFAQYCGLYANNLDVVSDTVTVGSLKNLSMILNSKLNGTTIVSYSDNVIFEGCTLTHTVSRESNGINIFRNNVINTVFTT